MKNNTPKDTFSSSIQDLIECFEQHYTREKHFETEQKVEVVLSLLKAVNQSNASEETLAYVTESIKLLQDFKHRLNNDQIEQIRDKPISPARMIELERKYKKLCDNILEQAA